MRHHQRKERNFGSIFLDANAIGRQQQILSPFSSFIRARNLASSSSSSSFSPLFSDLRNVKANFLPFLHFALILKI
jgi:hypothetical protein